MDYSSFIVILGILYDSFTVIIIIIIKAIAAIKVNTIAKLIIKVRYQIMAAFRKGNSDLYAEMNLRVLELEY